MIDQIQRWSALAGLTATVADPGPPFRVRLTLEDIKPPMEVEVQGPPGADDPYRFHTGFELSAAAVAGLPAARVSEIVEAAVLGRSALADARRRSDGSGVEMIAVIYPDGLTRHTFMTAIYECQKLRQIITREVEASLVAESALNSLLALAETTEDLAATVPPEAPPAGPSEQGSTAPPEQAPASSVAAGPPPSWASSPAPAPAAPSSPTGAAPPTPPVLPEAPLSVPPLPHDAPGPGPAAAPGTTPAPPHEAAPDDAPPRPTWEPPPLPNVPPPLPPRGPDDPGT